MIVAGFYQAFIDEVTNIYEKVDFQQQKPRDEFLPTLRMDQMQDLVAEVIKQTKA